MTPRGSRLQGRKYRTPRPRLELLEDRLAPAIVNWNGAAGDLDWNNPANWSTNALPGPADDVVIGGDANSAVTHGSGTTLVQSIQSSMALSILGGSIEVTANSSLTGNLDLEAGATLIASGAGTTLSATGATTAMGANLTAENGAILVLGALAAYSGISDNTYLIAQGAGSMLELPALATLVGGQGDQSYVGLLRTNLQALDGGAIDVPVLQGMTELVSVLASGTDSQVLLPQLASIDSSGFSDELEHSFLQVDNGGSIDAPVLSSLIDVGLRAYDGTTMNLPALTSEIGGYTSTYLVAQGAGSRLELPALTTLVGGFGDQSYFGLLRTNFQALDGGAIDVPVLPGMTELVSVLASGTNSQVLLPQLTSIDSSGFSDELEHSFLQVDNGGSIDAPVLSNLIDVGLRAYDGTTMNLPALTSEIGGYTSTYLVAQGAGSRLELPALTTLVGGFGDQSYFGLLRTNLQALDGGAIEFGATVSVSRQVQFMSLNGSQIVGALVLDATTDAVAEGSIVGSLSNGGVLSIGSDLGSLTITGDFSQTSSGTLNLNLAGYAAGTQFDQIQVSGHVQLAGTLTVIRPGGFTPMTGDHFAVLTYNSVAGDFETKNGTDLGGGSMLVTVYQASQMLLADVNPFGNGPPIADAGGPYTISEGGAVQFDASGSSDPDQDSLTYSWDINGDGIFGDATGVTPTLSWNQLTALGVNDGPESFNVQVQVDDGNAHIVSSPSTSLDVLNAAPTASLAGPGDGVRGQARSFILGAADSSSVDQAAGFTYAIDWDGNGSVDQTISGPAGLAVSHAYASAGSYTVRVTATDKDGGTSSPVSQAVNITAFEMQGNDLAVGGTGGDDIFTLSNAPNSDQIVVVLNGATVGSFAVAGSVLLFGSGGTDTVIANGTKEANAFTISTGSITLNSLPLVGDSIEAWHANGLAGSDTFLVTGGAATIDGGSGADTLVALGSANNSWNITGSNAGTLNGDIVFSSIANLTGGDGNDSFVFAAGQGVSGQIDGGSGMDTLDYGAFTTAVSLNLQSHKATKTGGISGIEAFRGGAAADTLIASNTTNAWTVSGSNSGSLNGSISFQDVENLTGGTTSDTFTFLPGGSIAGNLKGGAPVNTLDYSGYGSAVTVDLQTKTASGIGGAWANVGSFIGTGTNDTLIGANSTNTWLLTGANAGTVGAYSFTGFPDLTGGTGNDTFKFAIGSSVSGVVDGQGGANTLDYSGYGSPVVVNLQTTTAMAVGASWENIQSFKGTNTTDTFIATDGTTNTWTLKGSNAGTVAGVTFSGFANLTGGSGADVFQFDKGAAVSGAITGLGGLNTLNYSAYTTGVTVNLGNATTGLTTGMATGVNGGNANGIANIDSVVGGSGNNFLTAVGVSTDVSFSAAGNGNNILVGGAGNNTLTVSGAGNNIVIGGQGISAISGGTGYNLLIGGYTSYDAVYADLQSILGIWTTVNSATKYAQAIAKLTASSYAYVLSATTVHGRAGDTISAGTHALDWYFANLASAITGEKTGETVTLS